MAHIDKNVHFRYVIFGCSMADNEDQCDLCYEEFDRDIREPRKLPCCHTYCSKCLEKMISETLTVVCPSDRSTHTLGPLGIFGLPIDSAKLSGTCNIRRVSI